MNNIMIGKEAVVIADGYVVKNGINYMWPWNIRGNHTTVINGNVYIDGYQLMEDGQWKRTLKAIWHLFWGI
jgi:hypothetical protein